jgi:hypothetical protein
MTTVADCIRQVGLDVAGLSQCATLDDEFRLIKKAYFKKILRLLAALCYYCEFVL